MSWMGSHGVGLGAGSAPAGLRRRAARWAAGGVAIAAALGGAMMAAPAAMAAPAIPVPCSTTALRNAIFFAPANSILVLHSGCVYLIGSSLPVVHRNLTIIGSNDTFRATGAGYTMLINAGPNLQITNLTFTNGRNTGLFSAGAILNTAGGALSLSGDSFVRNTGRAGGAIFNTIGASLAVTGSSFTGNAAAGTGGTGGAIANGAGSTTTVIGTVFTGNFASDDGGAIDSTLGTLNVTKSTFLGNQADGDGGAVANFGAVATLSSDGFTRNLAKRDGGGIATASTTNLSGDTFSLNRAGRFGGGLIVGLGTTTLNTTEIFANVATGPGPLPGGGIFRAPLATVSFVNNVIVKLNVPNNCTGLFCP
jgi:predicted outer membrane repeat protein